MVQVQASRVVRKEKKKEKAPTERDQMLNLLVRFLGRGCLAGGGKSTSSWGHGKLAGEGEKKERRREMID